MRKVLRQRRVHDALPRIVRLRHGRKHVHQREHWTVGKCFRRHRDMVPMERWASTSSAFHARHAGTLRCLFSRTFTQEHAVHVRLLDDGAVGPEHHVGHQHRQQHRHNFG